MYHMSVIWRDQSESERQAGARADGQEVRHALFICECAMYSQWAVDSGHSDVTMMCIAVQCYQVADAWRGTVVLVHLYNASTVTVIGEQP